MAGLKANLVQNDALGKLPGNERKGLTSQEAQALLEKHGPNEIPVIETPIWKMILSQFVGTMPVMLEVSCIISAAAGDWPDFFVILAMVLVNAALGFREEMKAKNALEELTNQMESSIPCLRDGKTESLPVSKLVPGDVIHLRGGALTPADVEWLEGDTLSIDTAALTGEPLPRKYPSEEYGKMILSGTTIKSGEAYCIVRLTGTNTEIGQGQADIMADRATAAVSVFEQRVMVVVNIIISVAVLDGIIIVLVQGLVRNGFDVDFKGTLLTALSILIAAVPIALPLVLQVTMAIGAYRMATDHHAIVTRMSALQDIASMDVLCSDKTGTLTTAKMSINLQKIWTAKKDGFGALDNSLYSAPNQELALQQMLIVMGILASNADKKDDAIDGSLLRAWEKMTKEQGEAPAKMKAAFQQLDLTGFNPEVKRTVATVKRLADGKKLIVAKGLASKILDTSSGGADSGKLQWKCEECKEEGFLEMVQKTDLELSAAGYKTIAVAAGIEGEGMHFLGLLPMIDPPRFDTAVTIQRLQNAGVEVKMITGDHLNIAIETARMVGMATNILPGEATREGGHTGDETIREAGGFAQVLPRDKRECVLALQRSYDLVVGMTGDGVNDAPALSAAQCGIAVEDATDAAKNAAAMILTTEGLSAVFGAVVESRKIFARLFSYVSYRLAATIQILLFLSILVYVFDCTLDPLYAILLAPFNDVTMIPVAEDNQSAAAEPQHAMIGHLIGFSMTLGIFQSVASIIFYLCMDMGLIKGIESHTVTGHYPTSVHAQNAIWLQVSIAAEFLIFSARSPGLFFFSRPSNELLASTMLGNIVSTLLAVYAFPEPLDSSEIITIWVYDLLALLAVDLAKMVYKFIHEAEAAGIIDEYQIEQEDKSLQHGDETKPVENPEAHIKKYRESVMIMKQNSVRLSQKPRSSMKFSSTGQQRSSRIVSQSSNMSSKNFTQTRTSIRMGDDLRKRTPANSIRIK
uniref:Plasma membrane ATPase n=5 Tax=Symbiodinium TaxID=2949 RepID=D2DVW3_9DINO|nr:P-type proton ATPase [Symbiodinium sp. DZ-2009a]